MPSEAGTVGIVGHTVGVTFITLSVRPGHLLEAFYAILLEQIVLSLSSSFDNALNLFQHAATDPSPFSISLFLFLFPTPLPSLSLLVLVLFFLALFLLLFSPQVGVRVPLGEGADAEGVYCADPARAARGLVLRSTGEVDARVEASTEAQEASHKWVAELDDTREQSKTDRLAKMDAQAGDRRRIRLEFIETKKAAGEERLRIFANNAPAETEGEAKE